MKLITEKESLPPLERTIKQTEYQGTLPVIIFTQEERREYLGWNEIGWPGLAAAKELARSQFKADPKCHRIAALWLNEPGAATEALYEGAYSRSDFEKGGIYADAPPAPLHYEQGNDPKRHLAETTPGRILLRSAQSPEEMLQQTLARIGKSGTHHNRRCETSGLERPYKSFPPLEEMKIATISCIMAEDETDTAKTGMYMIVPPHFPNACKVFRGTVGYYARLIEDGQEDNFYVKPAPTVALARAAYEELLANNQMPDFLISVQRLRSEPVPYETAPRLQRLTCCCGATATLRRIPPPNERFIADSPGWKFRKGESRDIHLPFGWYCGRDGHYTERSEVLCSAGD